MTTYQIFAYDPEMAKSGNFMANLKSWKEVELQVNRAASLGLQNITVKVIND